MLRTSSESSQTAAQFIKPVSQNPHYIVDVRHISFQIHCEINLQTHADSSEESGHV